VSVVTAICDFGNTCNKAYGIDIRAKRHLERLKYMKARVTGESHDLLKVAHLYYVEGLNQNDIAKRFGVSRPTIVRMLRKAREAGLVEIKLTRKLPDALFYETELEKAFAKFGLNEAVVVADKDLPPKETVSRACARYLEGKIRRTHILGVGWSSTLRYSPTFMRSSQVRPGRIVQMAGAAGGEYGINSYEISYSLGNKMGITVEHMPAPVLMANKASRDVLLGDPQIKRTFDWVTKCNIGIIGVGDTTNRSTLLKSKFLTESGLDKLVSRGAVGDLLGNFYDIDGNVVKSSLDQRRISANLDQIRKIANIVALACGKEKSEAILGAIHGGYINTLIIDLPLAKKVLSKS